MHPRAKNINLRSLKTDILPKGLVLGFGKNIESFLLFLFRRNRLKQVFGAVLDSKQAFLDYKHINLTKSLNGLFSTVVSPWF